MDKNELQATYVQRMIERYEEAGRKRKDTLVAMMDVIASIKHHHSDLYPTFLKAVDLDETRIVEWEALAEKVRAIRAKEQEKAAEEAGRAEKERRAELLAKYHGFLDAPRPSEPILVEFHMEVSALISIRKTILKTQVRQLVFESNGEKVVAQAEDDSLPGTRIEFPLHRCDKKFLSWFLASCWKDSYYPSGLRRGWW